MRILITAGPTREHLDPIRFLSNPSSGRMGLALAKAAVQRGHDATLVLGPVAIAPPTGVRTIHVISAAEMLTASRRAFRNCDAAVFAAAVCDYRPAKRHARKVPKHARRWALTLEPTPDIAAALGRIKGRRITVCFALEDHAGRIKAEAKLNGKHADAIVLNGPANVGVSRGRFEFLIRGEEWHRWPAMTKSAAALRILQSIERLVPQRITEPRP